MSKKEQNFEIDAQKHRIHYVRTGYLGMDIYVDGNKIPYVMKGFNNNMFRYLQKITLNGKDVYLEMVGVKLRVALDSRYVDNGKPFLYLEKPPVWSYIFITISLSYVIFGAINSPVIDFFFLQAFVFLFISVVYIFRFAMSSKPLGAKITISFLLSLIGWVMFALDIFNYYYYG